MITSKKSTWNFTNSSNKWEEWRTVLFLFVFISITNQKKHFICQFYFTPFQIVFYFLTAFTHVFTTPTPPLTIYAAHNIC